MKKKKRKKEKKRKKGKKKERKKRKKGHDCTVNIVNMAVILQTVHIRRKCICMKKNCKSGYGSNCFVLYCYTSIVTLMITIQLHCYSIIIVYTYTVTI